MMTKNSSYIWNKGWMLAKLLNKATVWIYSITIKLLLLVKPNKNRIVKVSTKMSIKLIKIKIKILELYPNFYCRMYIYLSWKHVPIE